MAVIDPVELSQALIRCPSVTPVDAGALDVLETALVPLGFTCTRLPFSEGGTPDVDNLYARVGSGAKNFCFAGHTDVVPVGDTADWASDPFAADIRDGVLYGRGAADMKCAIAAFAAATSRFIGKNGPDFGGAISFLITGDEEGPAINGTVKMLDWLKQNNEKLDMCLVGEPTNTTTLGETIKIGRRGSVNATITVTGTQGHVAYPHHADNPVPRLLEMLRRIDVALDDGTSHFQPSNVEITTVDVGNAATNMIPARAAARINIRFNDRHTGASLGAWFKEQCDAVGGAYDLDVSVSGEAFLTPPGPLSNLIANAVTETTGLTPELSTSGGTSDARFIKDHCPVAEFGLMNETAHKVDENARVEDIHALADIYEKILDSYFA